MAVEDARHSSSPSRSNASQEAADSTVARGPAGHESKPEGSHAETPLQLSSPPASEGEGPVIARHSQANKLFGGLNSSVVTGEAANGLLELLRAGATSRLI